MDKKEKAPVGIKISDPVQTIEDLKSFDERTSSISLQDLPKPSFREVPYEDYKRRHNKKKKFDLAKETYCRYQEPTPEDLLNTTEYDMDDQDEEWLKQLNEQLKREHKYELKESDFELVMDRLEKESYFESKRSGQDPAPEVDEAAVCAICLDGEADSNINNIIFCDMCDLPVHQECYGVPYIPEGQWLCRKCLQSPSDSVECCLCPNKGGAFKQTEDGRWAHVICAIWIPEVCFANTVFLEPIDQLDQIDKWRFKLTCYICKQKKVGACIQCSLKTCFQSFHVTCAQQAGLHMRIRSHRYMDANTKLPYMDVKKEVYCDTHTPKNRSSKKGMYSSDEAEKEEDSFEHKNYHKKRKGRRMDSISKTRKILAEKRASDPNPVAEPTIKQEKLLQIVDKIKITGKQDRQQAIRAEIIRNVQGYWMMKRKKKKGVPLLRRLQVSFGGSVRGTRRFKGEDETRFTQLRYNLETARLLIGQVKTREIRKKKLFDLSRQIVKKHYQIMDIKDPVTKTED